MLCNLFGGEIKHLKKKKKVSPEFSVGAVIGVMVVACIESHHQGPTKKSRLLLTCR